MLGINNYRDPVKAPFAKQMQDTLIRFSSGKLSAEDKAQIKRDKAAATRFTIIWR